MKSRSIKELKDSQKSMVTEVFRTYGLKRKFERESGVPRQTLYRILKTGSGLEENVDAVLEFAIKQ